MARLSCTVSLALFVGCVPQGEDLGGGTTSTTLDVAGTYDSMLLDPTGCEGVQGVPVAWATGPLTVQGAASDLTFVFDGVELPGSVDATFTFLMAGDVDVDGWGLAVDAEGLAYIDADRWVLDGDIFVDADGPGGACTLSAQLTATQIIE